MIDGNGKDEDDKAVSVKVELDQPNRLTWKGYYENNDRIV